MIVIMQPGALYVAASRAKDQLWLFHSMDPSTLNANDLRRAMIEYASAPQNTEREELASLTDSQFEADVLTQLLDRGYSVTPQHQVGAYRIDMVVNLSGNERLAIECDGDRFHGPEHCESDVRRQRVLERLGWKFWRVRASAYYLDPVQSLEPLWQKLGELEAYGAQRQELQAQQQLLTARATQNEYKLSEEAAASGAAEELNPIEKRGEGDVPVADLDESEHPHDPAVGGFWGEMESGPVLVDGRTPDPSVDAQRVRVWAANLGIKLGERGRIPAHIIESYIEAQRLPKDEVVDSAPPAQAKSPTSSGLNESHLTAQPKHEPELAAVAESAQPIDSLPKPLPTQVSPSAEAEAFRAASIEAWRNGDVYKYLTDGSVVHSQTGLLIAEWMSDVNVDHLNDLLRRAIPAGGSFKLGGDDTVVIRVDTSVVRLGRLDLF